MSLAKIHRQKSTVERKCEKGGEVIAKGDEYLWYKVGFRTRFKHIRCINHYPTMSERESSLVSEVYAAQESFEQGISEATTGEELQAAFDELKDAIDNYATDREYAVEAWEHGNEQLQEVAEEWREKADNLEWTVEDYDGELDDEGAPLDQEEYDDWLQDQRDAATEAAEGIN